MKTSFYKNIIQMCDSAWYIFISSLKLSVFLLGTGCILYSAGYGINTVSALNETAQAVLLIAVIGARIVEAQSSKE